MGLPRNLGGKARLGYVAFGLALLLGAFLAPWDDYLVPTLLGLAGTVVAIEGVIGF